MKVPSTAPKRKQSAPNLSDGVCVLSTVATAVPSPHFAIALDWVPSPKKIKSPSKKNITNVCLTFVMFFFEGDLIPCLCPSKSIASKMRKQVLDLGCLVSVTQHQADKLSGHGRAAPYTMHASINIDKDGGETLLLLPPRHSQTSMRSRRHRGPRGICSGCEIHSAREEGHDTNCIKYRLSLIHI